MKSLILRKQLLAAVEAEQLEEQVQVDQSFTQVMLCLRQESMTIYSMWTLAMELWDSCHLTMERHNTKLLINSWLEKDLEELRQKKSSDSWSKMHYHSQQEIYPLNRKKVKHNQVDHSVQSFRLRKCFTMKLSKLTGHRRKFMNSTQRWKNKGLQVCSMTKNFNTLTLPVKSFQLHNTSTQVR